MKDQDDYVSGPHHWWIHFGFGWLFGAGLGVYIGWWQLEWTAWKLAACVAVVSIAVALVYVRLGDRAWEWLLERLWWLS